MFVAEQVLQFAHTATDPAEHYRRLASYFILTNEIESATGALMALAALKPDPALNELIAELKHAAALPLG